MSQPQLKYRRILLKYSGEALMGQLQFGVDAATLAQIAADLRELCNLGVQIGIVIGGGNLLRGKQVAAAGIDRTTADYMGMLATMMNALALRDVCLRNQLDAEVMSALALKGVLAPYDIQHARQQLAANKIVVFAGGLGSPFFTTDTAACLRAIEVEADVVLKATKVDGVYSADPKKLSTAKRYNFLTYNEVINQDLQVMDKTAICLCQENNMPLQVFDMNQKNALIKIVRGECIGTLIGASDDQ